MTNTLTEKQRDTLLELVPRVLAPIARSAIATNSLRRRPRHESFTIALCAISTMDWRSSPRSKSTAHSSTDAAGSRTTCSSGSPAAPTWGNCWRYPGNEQKNDGSIAKPPTRVSTATCRIRSQLLTAESTR